MTHKGEIRDTADREVSYVLDWCVLNIFEAVYMYGNQKPRVYDAFGVLPRCCLLKMA